MNDETPAGDVAVETIEHLDFSPRCEARRGQNHLNAGEQCPRDAAWTFVCIHACGTGGMLCAEHHDFFVARNPTRKCTRCQIVDLLSNLVIWAPLGGPR